MKPIFMVGAMTAISYFLVNQQLTDLHSLVAYHVNAGPAVSTSPGILLEIQDLGPIPDLLNQNLNFIKIPT